MNLLHLIAKDFKIEARTKQMSVAFFTMSIMLSIICAVGIHGAFIEQKAVIRIYPVLAWLIFIFSATFSMTRTLHYEIEFGALDGVLTSGVTSQTIFLSKLIVNTVLCTFLFCVQMLLLALLLDIHLNNQLLTLAAIGFLSCIGYCALLLLCGSMSINSQLKDLLLPLIVIPLIFPLFFSGFELTMNTLLSAEPIQHSSWFTLLLVIDLLYVVAGLTLFEYTLRS